MAIKASGRDVAYLVGATVFMNILASNTCQFWGVRLEPRDECEAVISFLNVVLFLAIAGAGYLAFKTR